MQHVKYWYIVNSNKKKYMHTSKAEIPFFI